MNDLRKVEEFATTMVSRILGDYGWRFEFNASKVCYGKCNYITKVISLSAYLSRTESAESIFETVVHEIGHAIAGYDAGHGKVWKKVVRDLGGNPTTTKILSEASKNEMLKSAKYVVVNTVDNSIVKLYYRKPGKRKMLNIHMMYVNGDIKTLGKLKIMKAEEYTPE